MLITISIPRYREGRKEGIRPEILPPGRDFDLEIGQIPSLPYGGKTLRSACIKGQTQQKKKN